MMLWYWPNVLSVYLSVCLCVRSAQLRWKWVQNPLAKIWCFSSFIPHRRLKLVDKIIYAMPLWSVRVTDEALLLRQIGKNTKGEEKRWSRFTNDYKYFCWSSYNSYKYFLLKSFNIFHLLVIVFTMIVRLKHKSFIHNSIYT